MKMVSFRKVLTAAALVVCAGPVCLAGERQSFIETFDSGNGEGHWAIFYPGWPVFVNAGGGNPGAYLTNQQGSWAAPVVRSNFAPSIFTGNYRALNVESIGIDLRIFLTQAQPHPDFSMTLMLSHDNGTPGTTADDTWIYYNSGQSIPFPGDGWLSYDFIIPSQLDLPLGQLPPGWQYYSDFFTPPLANHTWGEVMENVTTIWFIGMSDPGAIGALLNWVVGADNIRITWMPSGVPGDVTGDGTVNVDDLLAVINAWGPCPGPPTCPADLNDDGSVDVSDLLLVINNWT